MIENETRYYWQAVAAARSNAAAGRAAAACEAIDDLEAIATHGAHRIAGQAKRALGDMTAGEPPFLAAYARLAIERLAAA